MSGSAFIAVIGAGSIGARHLRNLSTLRAGPLVVVDSDRTRAERIANETGAVAVDSIASFPDIEAAFVCTPTSRHLEAADAALERGAHLYIEKPISHSLEGVAELLEKAERSHKQIAVGFNLRFHPCLRKLKELVREGALGRVLGARIEFGQYLPDWHPWEDYRVGYSAAKRLGGGVVLDATHEFDYARWLLGEVESVCGTCGSSGSLAIDTEDFGAFVLTHEGGAVSEIHIDYLQRAYARTCKVFGTEGTAYWDWDAKVVRCYRAADREWRAFPEPDNYDYNQMYIECAQNFLGAIRDGGPLEVDGADGTRTLAVAISAKEAALARRHVAP